MSQTKKIVLCITIAIIISLVEIFITSILRFDTFDFFKEDPRATPMTISVNSHVATPIINDIKLEDKDLKVSSDRAIFPSGWIMSQYDENGISIPQYSRVEIISSNDFDIIAKAGGKDVELIDKETLIPEPGMIKIRYNNNIVSIPASSIFVNVADIAPNVLFDIVYSYSAPSQCCDIEIPGLTGQKVAGYANGKSSNNYLGHDEFTAPMAYDTAVKLIKAANEVSSAGYAIKIWDSYRPYDASTSMSSLFEKAYKDNPDMQRGRMGRWEMSWYLASGASGHNFGTDVDITIVKADGTPIEMPSSFDTFDGRAHLVKNPTKASAITEKLYRDEILNNAACLALHRAMKNAGFGELASEWWHFTDDETKKEVTKLTGRNGANFIATTSSQSMV